MQLPTLTGRFWRLADREYWPALSLAGSEKVFPVHHILNIKQAIAANQPEMSWRHRLSHRYGPAIVPAVRQAVSWEIGHHLLLALSAAEQVEYFKS